MSTHSDTAKAIRTDLKEKFSSDFPNLKFKVTSSVFAGGDSVHVDWFNGPTVDEVTAIVNKYQSGHFNGMEDIYEYSNVTKGLPQVKFVQTQRQFNAEAIKLSIKKIKEKFGINIEIVKEYVSDYYKQTMVEVENSWLSDNNCWAAALIYRELRIMQIK